MTTNLCIECNVEFKVKHDADPEYYPITHCPFCGLELDLEEQLEEEPDEDAINT